MLVWFNVERQNIITPWKSYLDLHVTEWNEPLNKSWLSVGAGTIVGSKMVGHTSQEGLCCAPLYCKTSRFLGRCFLPMTFLLRSGSATPRPQCASSSVATPLLPCSSTTRLQCSSWTSCPWAPQCRPEPLAGNERLISSTVCAHTIKCWCRFACTVTCSCVYVMGWMHIHRVTTTTLCTKSNSGNLRKNDGNGWAENRAPSEWTWLHFPK